jgi:predicted XRE-type DNA-binding protein
VAGKKALTPAQREGRDRLILDMFLAGKSQQEISIHPQVKLTQARVSQIINAELEQATKNQIVRNENAMTIFMARMERLVSAAMDHVDEGELKAIEVARRLMMDQAKIFELADAGSGPVPPLSDEELDEDPIDDLAKYRQRRTGG